MKIVKIWSISVLMLISFASIAYGNSLNPYAETSTVYFDRLEVRGMETLEVNLTLKDLFFNPVTDAHPTFELNSSNGTPVDINLTSTSQLENVYTFRYQISSTTRDQNITFVPIVYYDGNQWKFKALTKSILFKAKSIYTD